MVRRVAPPLLDPHAPVDLPEWVGDYLRRERLCAPGEHLLVAVSGGPDSVALLHLLWRLKENLGVTLGVAHFHHGLRGPEAEAEAAFVAGLAARLGLPCHQGRGDTAAHAREHGLSLQMAARELRRAFLRQVCREGGYDKVAMGHTADDQIELFFLRLLRGAGLTGLAGMWPASPEGLIRPLLAVGKAVILAWLHKEGLPYRQDMSNLSPAYLRNRVRQELLPYLAAHYNPRLREGVWRLTARLQADERFLQEHTERAWQRLVRRPAPELLAISTKALSSQPVALQARLLQRLVAAVGGGELLETHRESLLALAQARQSGGRLPLAGCLVARAGVELHFLPPLPPATPWQGLLPAPGVVETPPGWRWQVRVLPEPEDSGPCPPEVVHLPAAQVGFPLLVRPPRPGDRCHPAGAPGRRKLQDVLTDLHIPRWLRPHLPLVLYEGRVAWVAGLKTAHPERTAGGAVVEIALTPTTPLTRRLWGYIRAFGRPRPQGRP